MESKLAEGEGEVYERIDERVQRAGVLRELSTVEWPSRSEYYRNAVEYFF